jgi:hypothetical protein
MWLWTTLNIVPIAVYVLTDVLLRPDILKTKNSFMIKTNAMGAACV